MPPRGDEGRLCRPCLIAVYLAEEALLLRKDFSGGIRMWHDKCKRKDCDCQAGPHGKKLLHRMRALEKNTKRSHVR